MAFSTPYTFTALELLTAAKMNAIQDNISAIWVGTTAGDIDYYTSSSAKNRVGIGAAYQSLRVNAGATAPAWDELHKCVLYKSGNQLFATASAGDITFDSEAQDTQTWHSTSVSTERITVSANGWYVPTVSIYWNKAAGGTGNFHITAKVQLNGADTANKMTIYESIDAVTKQFTFGGIPLSMTASQYLSINFVQDSGGNGSIIGGTDKTIFSVVRVA